jgi:DNA-binding protein H-NS
MAQSYAQMQEQIAKLQNEAKALRQSEVAGVVSKIKEAIAAYELTEKDLFDARTSASRGRGNAARTAKYADGKGGQWGGRGPRPQWLREALASGRKLEDFAVGRAGPAASEAASSTRATPSPRAAKKAKKGKKGSRARYSDGVNSWSGFGRKPGWLVQALDSGKSLEDFRG